MTCACGNPTKVQTEEGDKCWLCYYILKDGNRKRYDKYFPDGIRDELSKDMPMVYNADERKERK
uniref:Uncharacterized protein n=1 Tax=viral metagenome TaxID=1070528 RepID=A0A6M3Y1Z4_9ZZZZ